MKSDKRAILARAKKTIRIECENIRNMEKNLDETFVQALEAILGCSGKVVVTGVGKSGIIGRKIAATLASTGTPATILHPGDAVHGDLGMVSSHDIVLAISNSGETSELLRIVPMLKKIGAFIIAFTSSRESSLAVQSDIVISTCEIQEADVFGLIPSSSTTCQLVLGDAIALTLLSLKDFQKSDYAFFHPGGNLGKRLMHRVEDVMQTGNSIPSVVVTATMRDVINEINKKNLGFTLVTEKNGKLAGIITDGDLRRLLLKKGTISGVSVRKCMTPSPMTIQKDNLSAQALALMEKREIMCLAIVDDEGKPAGIVHMHDLLGKKEFSVEM